MKTLSVLFPGFTGRDLIGPTTAWGLIPNSEFQTVARTAGPVKVDMGLEIVATHTSTIAGPPRIGHMNAFRQRSPRPWAPST